MLHVPCFMKPILTNCFFCTKDIQEIDFRDAETLRKFTSSQAKIYPPRKTGTCAKHQRRLSRAIKRARILGLLPFTTR